MTSIPLKRCTKCGEEKPATPEYFNRDKNRHDNLNPQCKVCAKAGVERWLKRHPGYQQEHSAQYYAENTAQILEKQKEYNRRNAEKISERKRRWRIENPEVVKERAKRKYWNNRDKELERARKHRSEHLEEINQRRRDRRQANPEKYRRQKMDWYYRNHERNLGYKRERYHTNPAPILEQQRQYRRDNRETVSASNKRWRHNNPHKSRKIKRHYYDRKHGIPNDFTPKQWQYALTYFNGCCAVCGRQLVDLFGTHTAAQDHWIPVSKGGATTATNVIPLCHGIDGCNNQKSGLDAEKFLERKFGKRKAKAILKRIQAYFDSLKG